MDKEGAASHVDWVISVGLFVVYTLLMFIFLKPGIEPVYSQNNLINIIKSNLNNDTMFVIEKTPITIKPDENNFPSVWGEYQLAVENANFSFLGSDTRKFSMFLLNYSELLFKVEFGAIPSTNLDVLRFNSTFEGNNKNYTFFVVYSDYVDYNKNLVSDNNRLLFRRDVPGQDDVVNFTYALGVKEDVEGFSSNKLISLPGYSVLKERWKFPADRDFSVVVTEVAGNNVLLKVNDVVVPSNVNVFANTNMDWLLYRNLSLSPVNVTIRVW